MQPEISKNNMDYKFESKGDSTVSIYTEDANGHKKEIVRMDVWSKDEVATFRAITSETQTTNGRSK